MPEADNHSVLVQRCNSQAMLIRGLTQDIAKLRGIIANGFGHTAAEAIFNLTEDHRAEITRAHELITDLHEQLNDLHEINYNLAQKEQHRAG